MTDLPEGTIGIEIRGIYDGVSVWKLPDGTLVNRWPEGDGRHAATQAWIEMERNAR
jgi:hypothetical protein